jgi:predicted RNase H-like HicB family nuclease
MQRTDLRNSVMQYTVIVERGETSWGAYVPDLPGCIAAGETREEVLKLIREAIDFHIEGLRKNGEIVPLPQSFGELVEVPSA